MKGKNAQAQQRFEYPKPPSIMKPDLETLFHQYWDQQVVTDFSPLSQDPTDHQPDFVTITPALVSILLPHYYPQKMVA